MSQIEAIATRRARVASMTKQGQNAAEIARTLKVTTRTVMRDRVATGTAQVRHELATPAQLEQARQLLDDGCS